MADATRIYQGRQAHGWFGSGTALKAAPAEAPGGGAPSSLAKRVHWVAYGALAETLTDRNPSPRPPPARGGGVIARTRAAYLGNGTA